LLFTAVPLITSFSTNFSKYDPPSKMFYCGLVFGSLYIYGLKGLGFLEHSAMGSQRTSRYLGDHCRGPAVMLMTDASATMHAQSVQNIGYL